MGARILLNPKLLTYKFKMVGFNQFSQIGHFHFLGKPNSFKNIVSGKSSDFAISAKNARGVQGFVNFNQDFLATLNKAYKGKLNTRFLGILLVFFLVLVLANKLLDGRALEYFFLQVGGLSCQINILCLNLL